MNINCDNYENCRKQDQSIIYIKKTNKSSLRFLSLGCWGTYCITGNVKIVKFKYDPKENRIKKKSEIEQYGGSIAAEMMKHYSDIYPIEAVILSGDNVYSDDERNLYTYKTPSTEEEISDFKNISYNIKRQLSDGYSHCYKKIRTNKFLIGIGNHDIETCDILNEQMNYSDPQWTMPGLSYIQSYLLKSGKKIQFIFIDTNMYSEDSTYCTLKGGVKQYYTQSMKDDQARWLRRNLRLNHDGWNIVIGHIPFITNQRKKNQKLENPGLKQLLLENSKNNNQFI